MRCSISGAWVESMSSCVIGLFQGLFRPVRLFRPARPFRLLQVAVEPRAVAVPGLAARLRPRRRPAARLAPVTLADVAAAHADRQLARCSPMPIADRPQPCACPLRRDRT